MPTVFLSYQHRDEALARNLGLRLEAKGHGFKIAPGARVPGDWRRIFADALEQSDAAVFLLTENGLSSHHVLSQVGSARILAKSQGMLMLPVITAAMEIPDVVGDIQCFFLQPDGDDGLDRLAAELDSAMKGNTPSTPQTPRVFVSHRHSDESIAAALVGMLEAAFRIEKTDIRCTSVQPYTLPAGEQVSSRLRADVAGAQVVIGIIGPDTSESRYVLFELGASWGCGIPTFPVLVRNASEYDLPGPLNERKGLPLKNPRDCVQLVDDIAAATTLSRREGVAGRIEAEARILASIADVPQPKKTRPKVKKHAATSRK